MITRLLCLFILLLAVQSDFSDKTEVLPVFVTNPDPDGSHTFYSLSVNEEHVIACGSITDSILTNDQPKPYFLGL